MWRGVAGFSPSGALVTPKRPGAGLTQEEFFRVTVKTVMAALASCRLARVKPNSNFRVYSTLFHYGHARQQKLKEEITNIRELMSQPGKYG